MADDDDGTTAPRGRARFCPHCGTGLRPRLVERHEIGACPGCGYLAFRDPKVVAVCVVTDGATGVWLVRRAIEPCVGEWALPGGYVDFDEHPRDAAARECREEIGCRVAVGALLGVHHAAFPEGGVVVIAYAGSVAEGEPVAGEEVLEVRAFPLAELPPLAFGTHREIMGTVSGSR